MADNQNEVLAGIAAEMRASFANISDDITRLTNSVENGNVSDAVIQEFRDLAANAKALSDRTVEPVVEGGGGSTEDPGTGGETVVPLPEGGDVDVTDASATGRKKR